MRCWDLLSIGHPLEPATPVVIKEGDGARGVPMAVNAGQKLENH
jgi:hypothetical protein